MVANLEGSYCRNPDNDKHGPWCHTNKSGIPWDYCHVKPCESAQSRHRGPPCKGYRALCMRFPPTLVSATLAHTYTHFICSV